MSEGGIKMILVATDEEIYSTLQKPLDNFLGEKNFLLDAPTMRKSYIRPNDLANFIIHLHKSKQLHTIATKWLSFQRTTDKTDKAVLGSDLIKKTIDELLTPHSKPPQIERFELSLQIDTGNVIYEEFTDMEEILEFIKIYTQNPTAILNHITPKGLKEKGD